MSQVSPVWESLKPSQHDGPSELIPNKHQWLLFAFTAVLLLLHIPLAPNPIPLLVAIMVGAIYLLVNNIFALGQKMNLHNSINLVGYAQVLIAAITYLLWFYEDTRSLWIIYLPVLLIISFYARPFLRLCLVGEVALAAALGHLYELRLRDDLSPLQIWAETLERGVAIALPALVVYYLVQAVKEYADQLRKHAHQLSQLHAVSYRFQTFADQLDLLQDVGYRLQANERDEEKLWQLIANEASTSLGADKVLLFPVKEEYSVSDEVTSLGEPFQAGRENFDRSFDFTSILNTVIKEVATTLKPYFSLEDSRMAKFVVVPFISITDKKLLGVLWLGFERPQVLTEYTKVLIQIFAEQAEAAIVLCRSIRQEERHRIQIDLHDSVKSTARSLLYFTDRVSDLLEADLDMVRRNLHEVRRASWQILADTMLVLNNIDASSDQRSFTRHIRDTLDGLNKQKKSAIKYQIDDHLPPPRMKFASSLLCLLREGVINALEHAEASTIEVSVRCIKEHLEIRIHDDGRGFDTRLARSGQHRGLSIMRKRVGKLNGNFDIQSAPGKGTTILVSVPLYRAATPQLQSET